MTSPILPYRPRHVRFVELWRVQSWRVKAYGISEQAAGPPAELIAGARGFAHRVLARREAARGSYGVGFVGIHAGRGANVVFVDWWARENELHHHLSISPSDTPGRLRASAKSELTACVWDVALLCFERAAWTEAVLKASEPSLERYLEMRYSALI